MAANRYINRYKSELQRKEERRKASIATNKTSKFVSALAIGAGAAFAVHQGHPKGIIGALDDIAKPINAYSTAAKSTMDRYVSGSGRGLYKALDMMKNTSNLIDSPDSAIKHFQDTAISTMKETDSLHIDKLRKQKTNIVRGLESALKRDKIQNNAVGLLDELIADDSSSDAMRRAARDFKKQNVNKLSKIAKDYRLVKIALENAGVEDADVLKGASNEIFSRLNKARKNVEIDNIDNLSEQVSNKLMEGIIKKQDGSTSFLKRNFNNLFNYKQATADDLLNYGDDILDSESKDFLEKLMVNNGADLKKFVPDESLYLHNGKIVDSRNFKKLGRNIRSGFSNGILGHIGYQRDLMMMNEYAERAGTLIRSGHHVPTLEGTGVLNNEGILQETLLAVNDEIYRLSDMSSPVATGYSLASGRYGSSRRLISSMSGVNAPDWSNKRAYNWLLDVGGEREPGLIKKFKSIFTKSKDPEYMPNKVNKVIMEAQYMADELSKGVDASHINGLDYKTLRDINYYMKNQSSGFGHEILETIVADLNRNKYKKINLRDLKFNTTDELVDSYVKISKEYHKLKTNALDDSVDEGKLIDSAQRILSSSTQKKNKRLFKSNTINEGEDRLRKEISDRLIALRGEKQTENLLERMLMKGDLTKNAFMESQKTMASYAFNDAMSMGRGSTVSKEKIVDILSGNKNQNVLPALDEMLRESHPSVGFGRMGDFHDDFKGDVLPIKNFNPKNLNDWKSVITGGRKDMASVNKGTLATYGLLHRLNDMVRNFDFLPLAMSDDSMGSSVDMAKNIMFKRVMPIYGGFTALKYTSDYWSNMTGSGYTLEQHYERGKANATLRMARFKDKTNITNAFKFFDEVTPGSEGIKTSFNKMPFVGPLAPLAMGTELLDSVGALSGRSEEEWVDYFARGEDPVRKGRYWILGSTPWMGEGITHYEPNSYRQAMSQWKYTDTVYGSRENYWAHSWMPTPTEPFAPIKKFITDRYWFEEMHAKDRPYPLTGEMFDPNSPWGAVLNPTVGAILKPQFKLSRGASKEDLERKERQGYYTEQVISKMSGGDLQLQSYIPKYSIPTEVGVNTGGEPIHAGEVMVNGVAGSKSGNSPEAYIRGGSGLVVRGKNYSLQDIKDINQSIIDKSGTVSEVNKNSILDTGFTLPYYEGREDGELDLDVQDPRNIGYRMERALDIFKDIGGARGFLAGMALGGDDYGEGSAVLATSADAYATSARFWDKGLGGRGGEISEIVRRFINKRPGLYQVVNDIPNTMAGWLPERFQTGDPYCVSPDTLIEINKGELKRADEVNIGDIIRTHKGAEIPVKDLAYRQIEKDEDVFEVTVSTLPAFPFKVSEEHPILKVKDKRLIRNNVSINDYQSANEILDLLNENSNLLQKEISSILDKSNASISRIFKLLKNSGKIEKVKNTTVVKSKEHFDIQDLIKKSYDKKSDLENIEWEKIKDINVGDYVAYPLPKTKNKDFVLDLNEILNDEKYVFTEDYCYYTVDKKYAEMYEFHEKNPNTSFEWGERKELLERKKWNDKRYESAQNAVKRDAEIKRIKRFIKIDKDFMTLAGYYNAEGHTKDGKIEFSFHADEKKYHSEVIKSFKEVFGKDINSHSHKEKDNGHTLAVGLMPVADLFEILFGKGAKEKRVPEFFFNLKDELVISYLRSLINGDGSWFESFNRNRVTLTTISKKLAYQTRLLALKLRVVGAISKEDEHKVKIKSGPKKGQIMNLQKSYNLNFNGPAAVRIAKLCGFDGIEGSENIKGTQWNIDNKYLYLRVNKKDKVKNVPTVIGFEVGIDNSFCVLGVATHNTAVPRGEIRLPGEAYESMNKLHPDEYGRYGAVDRAAILADVAPYSTEYKLWSKIAGEQNLSGEAKTFLAQAKKQKIEANKKYHMTPYKFLGQDMEREEVKVEKFLDSSRFMVQGSDEIYRLAGVKTKFDTESEQGRKTLEILEKTMLPGSEISIITDKNSSSQNGSIAAVAYSGSENINKALLNAGVERKEEDGGIDTYVSLGPGGRALGKTWEALAHAPIPIIHNKFFNVNSPMEHYRENQVYGKEWQSWDEPIDDQITPTFQSAFAKHPVWAAMGGATAGAITGLLLGGGGTRKALTAIGGVVAGGGSIARIAYEKESGQAWIPERRQEERKLMEYYDLLEFVKNKRLYNKYVDVAKKKEGVDVEEIIENMTEIDRELAKKEKSLERLADNLTRFGLKKEDSVKGIINSQGRMEYHLVTEKEYIENKRSEILAEVRESKSKEMLAGLGPYARMAVKYRQESRSTLYGLDELSTFQQIYSAFPSKDREYLEHFSKAQTDKEREEILKIVPKNQKRAYKILWGMDGEKASLKEKFKDYNLPDEDWIGWNEGVEIEDSIIKLLENEGLDPKDFGFWKDWTEDERLTPAPVSYGEDYDRASSGAIKSRLEQVLNDYDITDIDIEVTPRGDNEVNVNFEMVQSLGDKIGLGIKRALGG